MAAAGFDDVILRDLKSHLVTARIPIESLSTLARQGAEELVQKFLTENINIEGSGLQARQSQLYIACFWGIREIAEQLLLTGADPSKQNKGSLWTPLHAATFQEHGPTVMLLLEYGAQPELPDSEGRTPKDFASASDKIWPLFAAMGLERTTRTELIEKRIIRKESAQTSSRTTGYGIKMADYSGQLEKSGEQESFVQAAMMGDVLADEQDHSRQSRTINQPRFSLWN
ncbi:oxysterol-binding protein-related protein 1-like [Pomacea canaliculata]|uniref:oxysterol-binding protein-related protein 1-like n=1 Tax=Pomacea canaliculata TaxID=400727 RepID=UPI000D735195|nr:oxysterol-binding protein-related protein 1-like [Pomacea canaliculata]